MQGYRAPGWLAGSGAVGGNLQTIWPALFSRRFEGGPPAFERERWRTPALVHVPEIRRRGLVRTLQPRGA